MFRTISCATFLLLFACAEDQEEPTEQLGPAVEIKLNTAPPGFASSHAVAFAAYQDGDGEWQPMDASSGIYTATVRHRRYGVAFACQDNSFGIRTIGRAHYRARSEETVINDFSCFLNAQEFQTITGSVTGARVGEFFTVEATPERIALVEYGNEFRLTIPIRSHSIWGVSRQDGFTGQIERVLRGPDLAVPLPAVLSLDLTAAPEVAAHRLATPDPTWSTFTSTTEIQNTNGTSLVLPASGGNYLSPHPSQLRSGDVMCVRTFEYTQSVLRRTDYTCLAEAAPLTVELPEEAAIQYLRPVTGPRIPQFIIQSESTKFPIVEYDLSISTAMPWREITVRVSRGWLGSERASCSFPDLSSLPGYLPSLELPIGTFVGWRGERIEKSTRNIVPGHTTKTSIAFGSRTID